MEVLSWLNKLNVFWSCVGLFLVVMILSLLAKSHQDPRWVFTDYENGTGFDNPYYVFVLGMIGATYTMFGSECSASMSEETENADLTSPIAMVTSITTAWVFGFIYLIVLLFSIQDIESVLTTTYNLPVTQVFMDAVGTPATLAFLCLMILCQFCSGATSVTVTSRQIYSLARGGAIPYYQHLQQLNAYQIPSNAVVAICIITCCMVAPYPLSDLFFEIIISAATITVYLTYSLVLGCKLLIGSGNKKGRFYLGLLSKPITTIAFFWSIFAVIAFTLPTCWPIDGNKQYIYMKCPLFVV
ncbi:amino acid/polyamine transporter I [Absidia repens]|uniref:Amino acid/polyamine transporter I n=1 Tax=Absidia repens TaxID=90262 RepID=A0A1X2IVL4_9FUNG|nr:amino acid/polyamine transporter I [Absidia repens]